MTRRLPDGSVVLEWGSKRETVSPDALQGWKPIEEIPEIQLPTPESVSLPPTVVLDLECTGLDPKHDRTLAAGFALYVNGEEEAAEVIRDDDEAGILDAIFGWLEGTCDALGEIVLTGYNISDFDLSFLIQRARRLRIDCPFRTLKDRESGEIVRWRVAATEGTLKGEPLDYPAIVMDLPITVVDALHLVCRWDYTNKALRNYDLKTVAAHFNLAEPNRPILKPEEICDAFKQAPQTFEAYLLADLRETFRVVAKLFQPYIVIAALTNLPLDQVVTRSTAWIWEQILQRYYRFEPEPDRKVKYEGGLVVSRAGLWSLFLKLDIASLYPTIMIGYRVHRRKDEKQIALRWLKTLTFQRLKLKETAKQGDANA